MNPQHKKNRKKIQAKKITGLKLKAQALLLGIKTNKEMAKRMGVNDTYVHFAYTDRAPGLQLKIHAYLQELKKEQKQAA